MFVLVAVAYLWRPQENAKDYAYVMQLPAMTAGDDGSDDELELTGVVPSAMDDDDNEIALEDRGGFKDEPASE